MSQRQRAVDSGRVCDATGGGWASLDVDQRMLRGGYVSGSKGTPFSASRTAWTKSGSVARSDVDAFVGHSGAATIEFSGPPLALQVKGSTQPGLSSSTTTTATTIDLTRGRE